MSKVKMHRQNSNCYKLLSSKAVLSLCILPIKKRLKKEVK